MLRIPGFEFKVFRAAFAGKFNPQERLACICVDDSPRYRAVTKGMWRRNVAAGGRKAARRNLGISSYEKQICVAFCGGVRLGISMQIVGDDAREDVPVGGADVHFLGRYRESGPRNRVGVRTKDAKDIPGIRLYRSSAIEIDTAAIRAPGQVLSSYRDLRYFPLALIEEAPGDAAFLGNDSDRPSACRGCDYPYPAGRLADFAQSAGGYVQSIQAGRSLPGLSGMRGIEPETGNPCHRHVCRDGEGCDLTGEFVGSVGPCAECQAREQQESSHANFLSITRVLIHQVLQRFAFAPAGELFQKKDRGIVVPVLSVVGGMAGDQNIVHIPQRAVLR